MSDMSIVIIVICLRILISATSSSGQYYYVNTYPQRPASHQLKVKQVRVIFKRDYKLVGSIKL